MEKRKPIKERMKLFESLDQSSPGSDSASPLTRQSSGESSPSYRSDRSSYGEKKKEDSLARHKRRQVHSSSSVSTGDKPKAVSQSCVPSSNNLPNTSNQALKDSFALPSSQASHSSLTGTLTSPTSTNSPSQTASLSFHFDSKTHPNPQAVSVGLKSSRARTSPQLVENLSTEEDVVAGGRVPTPPQTQRPAEMFVSNSRHARMKPSKGSNEEEPRSQPVRGVHSAQMVKTNSADQASSPPLSPPPPGSPHSMHHTPYSHDTLDQSPPGSDGYPSRTDEICGESGHSGSPCQVSDCKGPNKFVGGGHKSLMLDQEALTPKNSSRQPLTTQISSASTASSASSHKMIGLESSIPVQVITGEQKLVTSVERSLRVENEQLRERVRELLHEKKVLSEFVETSMDKQVGDGTFSLGEYPSGLDSNEGEAVGGAKLVLNRSSMKTDEEGHPVTPSAPNRRLSVQEESLTRQVQALKAQLGMRQTEIDTLTNENARREATISTLTKTVQAKDLEKRRGYHNQDVDVYLEQVSSLTGQMSAMDEQKREDAKKISELEQQVSKVSNIARLVKQTHDKNSALKSQVEQLSTALEEEKTLRSGSTSLISSPPAEERIDHRIVNLEAAKVPSLEKQVEELEKQLDETRRFEEMATKHQDEVFEKVKEVSEKDEEIRKLRVKIQDLEDMNISQLPSRTTSDTSLAMNSPAYQILLQDSTAKDEQIRQLQPVVEENERLRMLLEVKAQELSSKSIEAEQAMAEKDKQISVLGGQIEHKDKLNNQLRERVTQLTVPSLTSGEAGSTGQTDKIQRNAPTSKVIDAEKKVILATKKFELQVKRIKELETEIQEKDQGSANAEQVHLSRIRELEQQISSMKSRQSDLETTAQVRESKQQTEDVKLGQGSVEKELDQARATIAKMKSDREGFVEHAKKQSKAIADVRAQLEAVQQEKHQLQATLKEHNKDRSVLDIRLRKYFAANATLQEQVKELEQHEAESSSMTSSMAHKMEALQADLDRVRADRNERRQALQELRQVHDHSEQMIISQKAILENQRKEINDFKEITVPKLNDHLQRSQLENQQLARQKDELSNELEIVRQQVQVYLDDFNSERKDREAAHSRIAEVETRYTHQLTATAEELQTRTKELDAALLVNREVTAGRRQAEAELNQALRDKDRQLQEYAEHTHKLQEEIQSKTQQVKQYKKQVDQFRDQVEAGQDQATIHKAQVESAVSQSDELSKENQLLKHEIQNLNGRLRHFEATSHANQQQNHKLQAQLAQHLETINQLNVDKTLLLSELEQFKKEKGVAAAPAPPPRTSNPIRPPSGNRPPLLPNQGAMRPPSQPPPPSQSSQPNRQHLNPQWKAQSVDDSHLGSRGQRPAHTGQLGSSQLGAGDPRHFQHRTADMGRLLSSSPGYNPPRDNTLHQPSHLPHPASNADQSYPASNSSSSSGNNQHRSPYPPQHLLAPGYDQHGPTSLPPSIGSPTHGSYGHDRGMYGQREMGGAHYQDDIVDKDSPPSSYQSPGESTSHPSNARSQFVNKRQAFAQSSDSYYQSQTGRGNERPQAARPLPSPRIQADTDTSRAQHQHHGSGHPPSQTGGRHPVNPSYSSRVGHPYQESLGAAATQAPLPAKLKVQSHNIFTPSSQGQPHAGVGGGPRYPHTSTSRREETSASSDYSNQLDKDIDAEIRREAWKVARQGSGEESLPAEGDAIPLDPNLICPHCKKQFRLGEIQKFRKHAASCTK